MIEKRRITVPPLTGRKRRNLYVYVPEQYLEEDPEARFPVLYMFDGHNVFYDEDATYGKSWGMKEYLEESQVPVMVVAVECDHGKDYARLKEYAPYSFEDPSFGPIEGKGETYMDWLIHKLKPRIDREYPTLPGREATWIAGSSMGGLMSYYAVLAHNDVFSRAACLSPSVWFGREELKELTRKAPLEADTVIYMDYGSREMGNHAGMRKQLADLTSLLIRRGVWVTTRIVPNGDHCEACWEEQIPFFMETLLYQRD